MEKSRQLGKDDVRRVCFNDIAFGEDMLSIERDDGTALQLTRQERALLLQFTMQPGKLLSRNKLVELMARDAGDTSERNIDFLVNRLRKLLGDDARKPRFIATRYGEGYVWIAHQNTAAPLSAFLVIGPAYGLGGGAIREHAILSQLTDALDALIGIERKVACAPDWRGGDRTSGHVTYSLDASFHSDAATLHRFASAAIPSIALMVSLRENLARKAPITCRFGAWRSTNAVWTLGRLASARRGL